MAAQKRGGEGQEKGQEQQGPGPLKLLVALVAMTTLGVAALGGLGALVAWREGQPVRPPAATELAVSRARGIPALTLGARVAAGAAHDHLARGQRSHAAHALDAATRAADLAKHVAAGAPQASIDEAAKHLHDARRALHLGEPERARMRLVDAVDALDAVGRDAVTTAPAPPGADRWPAYEGAVVLNAYGVRVGELSDTRHAAGGAEVGLQVGGAPDVLGFIDVGTRGHWVPADQLLWGEEQDIGATKVALPVPGTPGSRLARLEFDD